ncbi:hypothetical protein [Frigoriglobus tundricola]|uniref:Uncharacterized protein n=1 Tax=Frigoriglobus tundricola TaxID=2774151 RepID=A0A6M5YL78_9BACT|nr:hypothetical protein [Frigoriglobus tundricola]QJW94031.1 hypothetical protein FTUN_1550 [Frigoriglobus tundricola]
MFQAKKWSWKRVAANLLLVPVLSGGSVAVVHAQLGRTSGGSDGNSLPSMPSVPSTAPKPAAASQTTSSDPKQLLKEGRKALAEGRFADAQDLAQRAAHYNPTDKWGLFDDTPAALRKDIDAAKARANKAQSEQLVKQAKALAAKPGANDAERAYNLDTAIQMARKADQLHGPYSTWDMGDRADKLVKELQESRAKIKVAAAKPPAGPQTAGTPAARPTTGAPASGAQTAGTPTARPTTGAPAAGTDTKPRRRGQADGRGPHARRPGQLRRRAEQVHRGRPARGQLQHGRVQPRVRAPGAERPGLRGGRQAAPRLADLHRPEGVREGRGRALERDEDRDAARPVPEAHHRRPGGAVRRVRG